MFALVFQRSKRNTVTDRRVWYFNPRPLHDWRGKHKGYPVGHTLTQFEAIQARFYLDLDQECVQNNGWPVHQFMTLSHLCVLAAGGTYFGHLGHKNAETPKRQRIKTKRKEDVERRRL
jgi:hypothetical protein